MATQIDDDVKATHARAAEATTNVTREVISFDPSTGEEVGRVPLGTAEDVDRAVTAATAALPDWAETPAVERARVLFRFRERLVAADALIIASPEYNASMPGTLKNLIDWASRYRPQPFNGKQGLLLSASPSMAGGNRGLWALRVPLEHLGMRVYPDMFSLAQAHQAFDASGRLANAELQHRLEGTIDCFMELAEAAVRYPALKKQWVEFLGERPDTAIDRVESAPAQAA